MDEQKIIKCPPKLFTRILQLFKIHADYHQSANSIFFSSSRCFDILNEIKWVIEGWEYVNFNELHLSETNDKHVFIDIGKSMRLKLKDKNNDRNGGKMKTYLHKYMYIYQLN